jgi:hypothetical protein
MAFKLCIFRKDKFNVVKVRTVSGKITNIFGRARK